jgi:two-component system sensor kinase FixL
VLEGKLLNQPSPSTAYRYGLAILTVGLALAIKLILLQFKVTFPLSSSFLAAIAITFWFGGTGPGILSVLLSSALFGFVVVPYQIRMLGGASPTELSAGFWSTLPYLLYFGLVALLTSWFSSSRRTAERLLNKARGELEERVEARTGDLSHANQRLQAEIVERRRAEEALRERAQLLDLTHDSVFVRNMSNVITYWNRGAEALYGWTSDEAVGQTSHGILHTVFPAPLEDLMHDLLRTARWEGELIQTRRDGTQAMVASRWALQRDEHGNPLAILETNNDITEQRNAEDALQRSQSELAHIARLMTMGELVASIAHEVNQPLAAIVTNGHACVRLLSREQPDVDRARDVASRMISESMRASEVIKRIRQLSHKAPAEKLPLNLNDAIREVVALVNRDLVRAGIALSFDLDDNLQMLSGDRIQIQQVILNLILNAKDAMKAPDIRRRKLLISTRTGAAGEIVVAVRDSGVGLDPTETERIFDPFFTTKSDGMGLGLSISRSIVESHGGRLWATPNKDGGITIQFALH